jgi:hypothetical protein
MIDCRYLHHYISLIFDFLPLKRSVFFFQCSYIALSHGKGAQQDNKTSNLGHSWTGKISHNNEVNSHNKIFLSVKVEQTVMESGLMI